MSPTTGATSSTQIPTFESLGVRTLINCRGTYTYLSGSRALKQVVGAMTEATNHYVDMDELMEKVGERLAELTGAEWGYIATGCAATLTEVTAACMAGADPERMARLPDTTGMKNEVIIQKGHRNVYDRAIRQAGARMVEVVTRADLEAAISERTAMLTIIGDLERPGQIPSDEMIGIGNERGIPCLVDAAAQRPDVPNRYLEMGADAVAYSGGKCLRGPQASGLILGRKDLLQAAFLNAAPHHALGRPMKAGKEEIMGLLAAVEAWVLGRDHQAEWREWEGYLEHIRSAIADLPSLRTEVRQPGIANVTPSLYITWDVDALHRTPEQVHRDLWDGEPRVALHLLPDGLRIMPFMMDPGDDRIVAKRLRATLANGSACGSTEGMVAPSAEISGAWKIHTRYVLGESKHSMTLEQDGNDLSGTYRSQYSSGELQGHISGNQIELSVTIGYQASKTNYVYTGSVQGGSMSGTVDLGEFWNAEWTARRVAAG